MCTFESSTARNEASVVDSFLSMRRDEERDRRVRASLQHSPYLSRMRAGASGLAGFAYVASLSARSSERR
jgi:hypothetical protein